MSIKQPLERNLLFLADYYHLSMAQGLFFNKMHTQQVSFEVFFRKMPYQSGYAVFAGLDSLIQAIKKFSFPPDMIDFLRNQEIFKEEFLNFLKVFSFQGNVFSVEEGEVVFPNQPLIRLEGDSLSLVLIESLVLNQISFQSLIATKSARIFHECQGIPFLEFGLRRAYGADGAFSSTRASFIGGAQATSNVMAGKELDLPLIGSMSHSWVMQFNSELESFMSFAKLYPKIPIFLIDTFNTLHKGLPSAIEAFKRLKNENILLENSLKAVRIDSGDLDFLSKEVRKILDENQLEDVKIIVSNELDEHVIGQLLTTKAPIDFFAVGTNLVTAKDENSMGLVYKLVSLKETPKGKWIPKMKLSDNPAKTTIPARKNIVRIFDKNNQYQICDIVCLEEEKEELLLKLKTYEPLFLYDMKQPSFKEELRDYGGYKVLLNPVMESGNRLEDSKSLQKIQAFFKESFKVLKSPHKRIINPHIYKVRATENLRNLHLSMIENLK